MTLGPTQPDDMPQNLDTGTAPSEGATEANSEKAGGAWGAPFYVPRLSSASEKLGCFRFGQFSPYASTNATPVVLFTPRTIAV